jgi:hypothetical protein
MAVFESTYGDITPSTLTITERVFAGLEGRMDAVCLIDGVTGTPYGCSTCGPSEAIGGRADGAWAGRWCDCRDHGTEHAGLMRRVSWGQVGGRHGYAGQSVLYVL